MGEVNDLIIYLYNLFKNLQKLKCENGMWTTTVDGADNVVPVTEAFCYVVPKELGWDDDDDGQDEVEPTTKPNGGENYSWMNQRPIR